jgi:glycerophosphoryl diester phosphodiesterase
MMIIGHRGARGEAPENTLTGFKHLQQLGIQDVELDIRLSKDNELVVIHDETLDRTCHAAGPVNAYSATELADLDATKAFKNWPEASGVPTLKRVIELWPQLRSMQMEVKTTQVAHLPIIAHQLAELIQQHQLQQQAVVTSMDTRFLSLMAALHPGIARGFIAQRFIRDPVAMATRLGCSYLVLNWLACTPNRLSLAHQSEMHVSVWTVNHPIAAARLARMGVDSLITDFPTRLLGALTT